LYALNLPSLLRQLVPEPPVPLPLLDDIVDGALDNFRRDKGINTLDFDLLINADERVTNATYLAILTALCQHWAHRVLEIEAELDLAEEQLLLVSKLFSRASCQDTAAAKRGGRSSLIETSKLLSLMLNKHHTTVANKSLAEI